MNRRVIYFKYGEISPWSTLGLLILGLLGFFVALPIFLGAVVVFGAVAGYLAWRVRKALREFEKECGRVETTDFLREDEMVIDITPLDKGLTGEKSE